MDNLLVILALAAVALALGWLFANALSWFFADDTRFFAPAGTPGRVTFKEQLTRSLTDLAELLALDRAWRYGERVVAFWLPRLTDRTVLAALFADFGIASAGEPVWLWIAQHPIVAAIVIVMNLFAASPKSAPQTLPR